MKTFSQLGIEPPIERFKGDKISIFQVINKEITINAFKIGASNFKDKGNGKRLDIQIEIDGKEHLIFSGSGILMEQLNQTKQADFPFTATIIKLEPKGFKLT